MLTYTYRCWVKPFFPYRITKKIYIIKHSIEFNGTIEADLNLNLFIGYASSSIHMAYITAALKYSFIPRHIDFIHIRAKSFAKLEHFKFIDSFRTSSHKKHHFRIVIIFF